LKGNYWYGLKLYHCFIIFFLCGTPKTKPLKSVLFLRCFPITIHSGPKTHPSLSFSLFSSPENLCKRINKLNAFALHECPCCCRWQSWSVKWNSGNFSVVAKERMKCLLPNSKRNGSGNRTRQKGDSGNVRVR